MPVNLLKSDSSTVIFLCIFAKLSRPPFLLNTFGRMFLYIEKNNVMKYNQFLKVS